MGEIGVSLVGLGVVIALVGRLLHSIISRVGDSGMDGEIGVSTSWMVGVLGVKELRLARATVPEPFIIGLAQNLLVIAKALTSILGGGVLSPVIGTACQLGLSYPFCGTHALGRSGRGHIRSGSSPNLALTCRKSLESGCWGGTEKRACFDGVGGGDGAPERDES